MKNKERNTEKIDSKIKPSTLTKILTRAEKERRNKSEMIRVILEESFEERPEDPRFNETYLNNVIRNYKGTN